MDGFLLVDKPIGMTSHDVVAKIRRILATEVRIENRESRIIPNSQFPIPPSTKPKVGHTGTLDPLASGLMILVLGNYTKRAQEFSKMDKTYEVELTLGFTSQTGDAEGPIEPFDFAQGKPSPQDINQVLKTFVGEGLQTPHAHSAVKIGGQRAYKLARAGKDFKIEPRKVTIYSIEKVHYKYPKLRFVTEVSSGTYIRSLAEDIGQKLGTGAYVSSLRRTKISDFDIKNAIQIDDSSFSAIENHLQR